MFNLSSIVQKAQSLIDPTLASDKPSKAALFRQQFRLPDSQNPLCEISAELKLSTKSSLSPTTPDKASTKSWDKDNWDKDRDRGTLYIGRLHLSEQYLCFSTINTSFLATASNSASSTFTGQTNGAGPFANGFTLPLCAVRRVERLHSQTYMFALSISTWNGYPPTLDANPKSGSSVGGRTAPVSPKLVVHLSGSRHQCERFCDGLKKGLREGMKEVENMRKVVSGCYSEYMLAAEARRRERVLKEKEAAAGLDKAAELIDTKDTTSETELKPPDAGLGMSFKYPGDPRKLRDKGKMRLWYEYLKENGRSATLVRQPDLARLVRIGLPNRLRGETWEVMSGAFYLRLQNPKQYQETLDRYHGQNSLAIDEIEKDLNRSLPEYPAYQNEEGIGRLRRVLTAYSWVNLEVGYCQAMNIVVAALLIYLSESQAFYVLSILCDNLLPGYYSTTMYGTLLDQRVFESLVERTLPILSEHLSKSDVQLSVVSLPWFLSLYINSMPLVFAFRVLDVFFLEGPKVLFQVGLAILRINGEELLDAGDDGTFISVLKSYFTRLADSAHPTSENPKLRAVTNFQALMVVAFREFAGITQNTITELRTKHKGAVLDNIESFAKRTSIRNLGPESKRLSLNDLGFLYDRFYGVLHERGQRAKWIQEDIARRRRESRAGANDGINGSISDTHSNGNIQSSSQMDYGAFREFLAGISKWAISDQPMSPAKEKEVSFAEQVNGYFSPVRTKPINLSPWGEGPEPADHDFMKRLYKSWDKDGVGTLSLQNVVAGLARIKGTPDIMNNISYFFELYDEDNDEKIDREAILNISEGLLFLSRRGINFGGEDASDNMATSIGPDGTPVRRESKDDQFLSAISAFTRRCFEYADPGTASQEDLVDVGEGVAALSTNDSKDGSKLSFGQATSRSKLSANAALDPEHPLHLTLPSFRMLVLADEGLESFFDSGFPNSFHLADAPLPSSTVSSATHLTTFASANALAVDGVRTPVLSPAGPAAGVVAPGRGLRGMLDNIVTDGMRVAAEVKRRMDEAQKELERAGGNGPSTGDGASGAGASSGSATAAGADVNNSAYRIGDDDDEDEDEDDLGGRDLLQGADAQAGGPNSAASPKAKVPVDLLDSPATATSPAAPVAGDGGVNDKGKGSLLDGDSDLEKSTVFER